MGRPHPDPLMTFGPDATAIAFPLGGIGTGNVSLGARGDLRDWELEGEANKGSTLPNAFFALWIDVDQPEVRVIEGPLPAQLQPSHGLHPTSHAGVRRFPDSRFTGTYPTALVEYIDETLPVRVELESWTPFIPLDADESGLPVAVFEFSVTNRSTTARSVAIAASMMNPVGGVVKDSFGAPIGTQDGRAHNRIYESEALCGVVFENSEILTEDVGYGTVALVTERQAETAVTPTWRRGGWWDDVRTFWSEFSDGGRLERRDTQQPATHKPDTGSVASRATIEAGETSKIRFYLSWYFPNRPGGWCSPGNTPVLIDGGETPVVRKRYAARFGDASTVAEYAHEHRHRLDAVTFAFRDTLFDSSLPPWITRPVSANIVTLRSPTCFWLEDGTFYGWEGCYDDGGCCPGSCTHVWSYAYTGAYLFPELERSMRVTEYEQESTDSGYMNFRAHSSFGEEFVWVWGDGPRPAIDGQLGTVIRTWREFLLSGDREWLERLWPRLQRTMDYCTSLWDPDRTGVVSGTQHTTYDIDFDGPNPLAEFIYLTALEAAAAVADVVGHVGVASTWRETAAIGRQSAHDLMWNGSYYVQPGEDSDEIPYQHGTGCLADQLLGYAHAIVNGLPSPVPNWAAEATYRSVFEHNYRSALGDHDNYQRVFASGSQAGTVLCTWPFGGEPELPFPYSDEVWTGVEYHLAAGMVAVGLHREAEIVLTAAADRHDGRSGNPWDEIECGHHYARAMSSWMLLLTATGQVIDADGALRFRPRPTFAEGRPFRAFYSDGRSWGTITIEGGDAVVDVFAGTPPPRVEVDGARNVMIRTRQTPGAPR